MRIKEGASLQNLRMPMRKVLVAAEKIWQKYGQELVVTSGTDGEHSAGSLHYYGYALDFRTRYFTDEEKSLIGEELRNELIQCGVLDPYRVIIHKTHIHVEWRGLIGGIT
jgi:hypothetical protein